MNTNLELYKTFYYVAKHGNITQAANELCISQPAISKAIKTLESELNTVLFNRNNNGVTLTDAGELIYGKVKRALDLLAAAEEDLNNLNEMNMGVLRIGAGNTIMQNYLIPIINKFRDAYPNITISVHTLSTPTLIKQAQVGLIDIIFTHLPNDIIPNNFKVFKIKELHDTFVVKPGHELLNKTITKKDIPNLPLILLPYNASNRKSFDQFLRNNNLVIKPTMEIGNDIIIKEFAQGGYGVGLVTKEYVTKELESNTLCELKTNFKFTDKHLCYCIDENRVNNNLIKHFIEFLN